MTSGSDNACLFCSIVAGAVPSTKVDEDERTYAFMDINPANDGHLLVVPKTHATDLRDIAPDDLAAVAVAAQRIAVRAMAGLGADGVNLLNCCGPAAWQTVFHFHLHVIPRYADDRDRLRLPWTPTPGEGSTIDEAAARITGAPASSSEG